MTEFDTVSCLGSKSFHVQNLKYKWSHKTLVESYSGAANPFRFCHQFCGLVSLKSKSCDLSVHLFKYVTSHNVTQAFPKPSPTLLMLNGKWTTLIWQLSSHILDICQKLRKCALHASCLWRFPRVSGWLELPQEAWTPLGRVEGPHQYEAPGR